MKNPRFLNTLFLAFALAFAPFLSAGPFADNARPYVDEGALAGAVFLVADHEKVLACEAVGQSDIASKRAMREDDIFWIASMTKSMTAVAMMMLVDEGKVSLDDPVSKYIPEFAALDEKFKTPVTIRHLISNMSGIPNVVHGLDTDRKSVV